MSSWKFVTSILFVEYIVAGDNSIFNEYDVKDETNIGYFLENTYKPFLEEKVGKIIKIKAFTSKQFVKIRDGLDYGFEWKNDNILTTSKMYNYWVDGNVKGKMLVVSRQGSYKMVKPTAAYYTRCVITISKDSIKKD